jgi:hypothetical protein
VVCPAVTVSETTQEAAEAGSKKKSPHIPESTKAVTADATFFRVPFSSKSIAFDEANQCLGPLGLCLGIIGILWVDRPI